MGRIKMSDFDSIQKFLLENSGVRGEIARLEESFQTILAQHAYPISVRKLLGEVLLAASMLSALIKLDGRLTIQFESKNKRKSAISLLVAQINDKGHLRGLAQWREKATEKTLSKGLGDGHLVMTIFQNNSVEPLQSIVPIEKGSIAHALEFYFLQSEQLPTQFIFAVNEKQAVGFLLQQMPEKKNQDREILWKACVSQMKKIKPEKLLAYNNTDFLQTYFGDDEIRIFDSTPVKFQCSCSIEKMKDAIYVMGEKDANSMLKNKREISVICEYCNHQFGFDQEAISQLFDLKRNVH